MISSFDPTSLGGRRRYLRTSVLFVLLQLRSSRRLYYAADRVQLDRCARPGVWATAGLPPAHKGVQRHL